jgi:hypothetical protein
MDQDGITDIGLWVPDRSGITPQEAGEWFFLISGGTPLVDKDAEGDILLAPDTRLEPHPVTGTLVIPFTPVPFGDDFHAQFGNEFAIPCSAISIHRSPRAAGASRMWATRTR